MEEEIKENTPGGGKEPPDDGKNTPAEGKNLPAAAKDALKKSKTRVKAFFGDFKKFIAKGNIASLAVALIIGSAFTAIVNSLVGDVILPLFGLMLSPNALNSLNWTVPGTDVVVKWGHFIEVIIDFIIISFVIFCVLRLLVNADRGFKKAGKKRKGAPEATAEAVPLAAAEVAPAEKTPATNDDILAALLDIKALLAAQKNEEKSEENDNEPK